MGIYIRNKYDERKPFHYKQILFTGVAVQEDANGSVVQTKSKDYYHGQRYLTVCGRKPLMRDTITRSKISQTQLCAHCAKKMGLDPKRRSKTMSDQQSWDGTQEWGAPAPPPPSPRTDGAELFYIPLGDTVTIRIGTPAYRWDNRKRGDDYPWEKFACGCILKTDSANPGMEPKAIVLTEEGDILRSINEIASEHGSPLLYDLKITKRKKTQENGWSSAEVVPSPAKDAGLSEHEISLLAEGQCSTVGQVEATMLRVRKAPKAAPKPSTSAEYNPDDDPFVTK